MDTRSGRWGLHLCAALLLLFSGACERAVRPGASYEVRVITKGADGKVTPQGKSTQIDSTAPREVQKFTHEGQTLSLLLRKTQYQRATFEVTFPDKSAKMVQVRVGQPKDVLSEDQKVGLRIELRDSH